MQSLVASSRITCRLPSPVNELTSHQSSCIEHTLNVLKNISRTFKGESNTDTSADKEKLLFTGQALVDKAARNFRNALATLFSLDDNLPSTPTEVKQLLGVIGLKLNEELMPATRGFWRTWDTPFEGQSKKDTIKSDMSTQFYPEFLSRLHDAHQDPVEFAVWTERTINRRIHPLNDGCGKLSKALTTWILGRSGIKFPTFASREEYFDYLLSPTVEEAVQKYEVLLLIKGLPNFSLSVLKNVGSS